MSMQLMREKKKLIYTLMAIIVIPSFVLFWGAASMPNQSGGGRPFATIDAETVTDQEFYEFQRRMRAIHPVGGLRIYDMSGIIPHQLQRSDTWDDLSGVLCMALIREAEKAGVGVSEAEIATFAYAQPIFHEARNAKDKSKAFERLLGKAIESQLLPVNSRMEYKRAVREFLLLKKYLEILDRSLQCTTRTAYAVHAREKTKCTYQRLVVNAASSMEDGRQFYEELAPEELDKRIEEQFEIAADAERDDYDRRYWTDARWRVEYVLALFEVSGKTFEPSEEEIEAYYKDNRVLFKDEETETLRPLEKVRTEIVHTLKERARSENSRQALNAVRDVINDLLMEGKPVTAEALRQNERLAALGVKAGDSGEELKTPDQLLKVPAFENAGLLERMLAQSDYELRLAPETSDDPKVSTRPDLLASLRQEFQGVSLMEQSMPLHSEKGLVLVRVLDYKPGEKKTLMTAEGEMDPALRKRVMDELVRQKAKSLALERVRDYIPLMRKNATADFAEDLEVVTKPYAETPETVRKLLPGEVAPEPLETREGYEGLRLLKRETPTLQAFLSAEDGDVVVETLDRVERQRRGDSVYAPWTPAIPLLRLGERSASMARLLIENERVVMLATSRR